MSEDTTDENSNEVFVKFAITSCLLYPFVYLIMTQFSIAQNMKGYFWEGWLGVLISSLFLAFYMISLNNQREND